MKDLFLINTQHLASQDINWWTGEMWIIVVFLSAVWTLILTAPIHCRGSIDLQVIKCKIYPNLFWWRNTFTSWMAWGWVLYQEIFIFGWTIYLKIGNLKCLPVTFLLGLSDAMKRFKCGLSVRLHVWVFGKLSSSVLLTFPTWSSMDIWTA